MTASSALPHPPADFPEGFLWGTATAAHQVEGGNVNNDHWEMEHAEHSPFSEPSGDACDSWHRWAEDLDLVADAGLNTCRGSAWSGAASNRRRASSPAPPSTTTGGSSTAAAIAGSPRS